MSRLVLSVFCLLFTTLISAQYCGTPQAPLLERVDVNKRLPAGTRNAVKYIPVTFHLVAATNGTGRIQEEDVFRQLANLNAQYADQEAIFYIDTLKYMNNDAVYNTPHSVAATIQMRLGEDKNSVNVFITNSANDGGGSPGTVLAYYDPQEDWIVSKKGQINGTTSTLAHELGHFFSLPHPHAGWDCYPYTTTDYNNPVDVNFTKPCDTGGGSLLIELQDGSNCATAGDRICDTPPDYNLGLLYQNDCDQNTSIRDKNNQVIMPMVNNFMGYYTNCANYAFTQTQKNLMNTDFYTVQRAYIRTGKVPKTTPVVDPVNYIYPINGEETSGTTDIVLDWADVPGANRYMVLIDRFSSFTFSPQKYFVYSSELTIDELPLGVTYYWKVWPYNESQTGAGYSQTQNFKVGEGTGVNDISEINDYVLSPNPTANGQESILTLHTTKFFDANINLIDLSGRVLLRENISVPSGESRHRVNTTALTSGIYFIVVNTASGTLVEKLMVE
ncbi:MAG: zinc-dependent metalloprotease [Bacteroidota bacterium]|nr:zinc-dependent metalloprotease [Bacteroidota bacterium]